MNLKDRLSLCLRILTAKPNSLLAHADRELLPPNGDEMQELMNRQLREMLLVFSTHGHSGFSAGYARHALGKLLAYEPLRPLTGEPDEWQEVASGVFQNTRCSRVFKDASQFDGQAYDIDAVVVRGPNGVCYTSRDSRKVVTFPYTPKTEYVDAPTAA
jgi:hypothetical protein